MPSCAVKWCKHSGNKFNKSNGITYHSFPRNKNQKDDWVQIIRESRDDGSWNPTSFATICSAHFDNGDFKTTAKGLRYLVRGAIPKRTSPHVRSMAADTTPSTSLSMTQPLLQVFIPTEENSTAGCCRLCAASYGSSKLINVQSDDNLKKLVVSMTNRLNTCVDFSQEQLPTTVCTDCVKKLYTAYDFIVGIDLAQITLNEKSVKKEQMPENIIVNKNIDVSNTSLQQLSPNIGAAKSNTENALLLDSNSTIPFLLNKPRKRGLKLKEVLIKKRLVIESQRKNLKRLNQKVRRLQNRNNSLKNIVKNLKERNLVA